MQAIADLAVLSDATVAGEIERFLSGETDGGALLHALYDSVAEEPIPERLLAVLRGGAEEPAGAAPCAPATA